MLKGGKPIQIRLPEEIEISLRNVAAKNKETINSIVIVSLRKTLLNQDTKTLEKILKIETITNELLLAVNSLKTN